MSIIGGYNAGAVSGRIRTNRSRRGGICRLFVLLRFIGKKHIGELSPFDFVVLLILSETVDGSLIGDDKSLDRWSGFGRDVGRRCAASRLFDVAFPSLERFVDGEFRILVRHGQVCDDVMRTEQVTRAELMEALRREGCSSLANIRYAILETDGSITLGVRPKD